MFKRNCAVEGYTEKGRIWIEVKSGVKNRKRGFKTILV